MTNIFERYTLLNKLAARRKFYTTSMQGDEKDLQYIASTLKPMGADIGDKEMALDILNRLPDRYDGRISAFDALGNEQQTFMLDFVKILLLQKKNVLVCGLKL